MSRPRTGERNARLRSRTCRLEARGYAAVRRRNGARGRSLAESADSAEAASAARSLKRDEAGVVRPRARELNGVKLFITRE